MATCSFLRTWQTSPGYPNSREKKKSSGVKDCPSLSAKKASPNADLSSIKNSASHSMRLNIIKIRTNIIIMMAKIHTGNKNLTMKMNL